MTEFTKGPWKISAVPEVNPVSVCGQRIRCNEIDSTGASGSWLAMVMVQPGSTDAEGIANAHLIAASPDLYEALKDLEWHDGGACPQCCATQGEPHQTKCILGNALAKAGGK